MKNPLAILGIAGFFDVTVNAETDRILGCTILSLEAGEMISPVEMTMIANLPFGALRDAVLTHPTRAAGFNTVFSAS